MRKTKIVCTIGPASESFEKLCELMEIGMNVCRLNFSHGSHEEHAARIATIREAAKKTGKVVAILLDTKGPEIRTHDFVNGSAELVSGAQVILSMKPVEGTAEKFSISYPGLIDDVFKGSKILIDDGLIELEVVDKREDEIITKVLNSGTVKNKKGVNVPNVKVKLPGITEKDAQDIRFGIEQGVDYIAPSFVRNAEAILEIRQILKETGAEHINLIPKIENQEGIDNIDEILEVSDGLMVARGDMGVEIPPEEVPLVQKMLINKCNALGKPVITATQMLDSMQRFPRPTRAEASDVANAILDGSDAIMLSGETAAGLYPAEAVQTMHNIAKRVEKSLNYKRLYEKSLKTCSHDATDAISQAVANSALALDVAAIVTPTESGFTAKSISRYRPEAPIIAITFDEGVARRLSLAWGVTARVAAHVNTTDEMFEIAASESLASGLAHSGDTIVITAGVPVMETGMTNLMKIHRLGEACATGTGLGRKTVKGKVVIAKNAKEAIAKAEEGCILVTNGTDKDMMPAIEKAAAIITEEGGLTSHAAVVGVSLGIPVMVGVESATTKLTEGSTVSIDTARGTIFNVKA